MHAATGALGSRGRYIARRLLERCVAVHPSPDSPHRENPFGSAVEVYPYYFDKPDRLVALQRGADAFKTYLTTGRLLLLPACFIVRG